MFTLHYNSVLIVAGMEDYSYGSHDYGDPSTTNIFLGSINPKVQYLGRKVLVICFMPTSFRTFISNMLNFDEFIGMLLKHLMMVSFFLRTAKINA